MYARRAGHIDGWQRESRPSRPAVAVAAALAASAASAEPCKLTAIGRAEVAAVHNIGGGLGCSKPRLSTRILFHKRRLQYTIESGDDEPVCLGVVDDKCRRRT